MAPLDEVADDGEDDENAGYRDVEVEDGEAEDGAVEDGWLPASGGDACCMFDEEGDSDVGGDPSGEPSGADEPGELDIESEEELGDALGDELGDELDDELGDEPEPDEDELDEDELDDDEPDEPPLCAHATLAAERETAKAKANVSLYICSSASRRRAWEGNTLCWVSVP